MKEKGDAGKESPNRVGREYNDFCIICGRPRIGKGTWIGYFTLIDGSGGLEIGEHCSIASGVHIYTHDAVRWAVLGLEKDPGRRSHVDRAPVKIGDNVFIGANSVVLKGVTIGNNVVVGALTLVNRDIPDNSVAVGNPARIVGKAKTAGRPTPSSRR